jgi:hypothetical protein
MLLNLRPSSSFFSVLTGITGVLPRAELEIEVHDGGSSSRSYPVASRERKRRAVRF